MKALSIEVYRSARLPGDYTNGGISSKYDELLVLCDRGYIDVDLNNPPKNLVVLERGFRGSLHLVPYVGVDKGNVGWMFGGNYAATSDSRFGEMTGIYGAIAIHDRQETQEMYDMLSR